MLPRLDLSRYSIRSRLSGFPRLGSITALALGALIWLAGHSSAEASVEVVIDISSQTMTVDADGRWFPYSWKVSTARSGYRTPIGTFKPVRLEEMHYSTIYDGSPMPHSIFFRGNFAIHGTEYVRSLGKPASHGCVRLSPQNAKKLYQIVEEAGLGNVTIRIVP